jgi:proteic killer suppression protein
MWSVRLAKKADKKLEKAPSEILERFQKWQDIATLQGPMGLRLISGFKDHALKGEWSGARSSRLNEQWRVIYMVRATEIEILVLEVTPHDYRKKS